MLSARTVSCAIDSRSPTPVPRSPESPSTKAVTRSPTPIPAPASIVVSGSPNPSCVVPDRLPSPPVLQLGDPVLGESPPGLIRAMSLPDNELNKKRVRAEEELFEPRKKAVTFSEEVHEIETTAVAEDGGGC